MGAILRKYGVQTTINFNLFGVTGVDLKTDAAHAAGDTVIMKDEGAEASTTNGFTDEGQGYSIVLTATEMQAARIVLYIVDQGTKVWLDRTVVIETYGHASAQHPFDLGTASTPQTGDNYARTGAPAGASIAADIAATKGDTAAILIDTNELQVDWTNGGRLDLIIDSLATSSQVLSIINNERESVSVHAHYIK